MVAIKTFLAIAGGDMHAAQRFQMPCAYLCYRVSADSGLSRADLPVAARGGLCGIVDADLPAASGLDFVRLGREVYGEYTRRQFSGVLFDFEHTADAGRVVWQLAPQLTQRKITVFVPHYLSHCAPEGAKIIVPSSLSGGSYDDMLRDYAARFGAQNLCLELVRSCADFIMPSESADGRALTAAQFQEILERERPTVYFSPQLCAKYFTYADEEKNVHFLLFDDPATAADKLRRAGALSYHAAFILYRDWGAAVRDIVI